MPTPTIDFDELVQPVTATEVENGIYQIYGSVGLDTSSWKSGAVVRTITNAFAVVLSALSELQARIAKSGFLALAEEDWLTIVAFYVYGVERYEATFALGEVTLVNAGGGVYNFDADDLIFGNADTGKTYRNSAPVSIAAGATVTNVPIHAVEAGTDSNAEIGKITVMVTTVTGVTVTNPIAAAGQNQESDAALRARCSAKLGSLSPNGPWDAYTYAVRNATRADGTNLGITRTRIITDGYGNVFVYMATASGTVPTTDVAIAQTAIELNAEPLAVNATAYSATAKTIAVAYTAYMYNTSGYTDDQVRSLIETNLTDWLSQQPIGGNLVDGDATGRIYRDKIIAVIGDTLPEIFHVTLSVPASDTTLTASEVAIFAAPFVGTINQSSPPVGYGV